MRAMWLSVDAGYGIADAFSSTSVCLGSGR